MILVYLSMEGPSAGQLRKCSPGLGSDLSLLSSLLPCGQLWTLNVPFLTTTFPFRPPIFRSLTGTFSALILTTTFQSPKASLSILDLMILLQLFSPKQSMSWLSGHGCGSTQWTVFCFHSRGAGICYKK
ncbi:hypothetical protein mRhiFer1_008102 [Rhinolophus ferrumequinum]|uniref:Uncharacterized protein n=1 Tax=Rhinolophus ferrumequinum TaxID=59479 RepID=A0A7J7W7C9_RHIFE|nr:hypothetical protein mRhiFer1_008102 [Rhinolophus ferrumequinum]